MSDARDSTKEIALSVLREKHQNGQTENIHQQVFYELDKSVCPVCGLPRKLYMQKQRIQMEASLTSRYMTAELSSHSNGYNPKNAPPPVHVKCACGAEDDIGYDSVYGPEYKRVVKLLPGGMWEWECSSCWWNRVGQNL